MHQKFPVFVYDKLLAYEEPPVVSEWKSQQDK